MARTKKRITPQIVKPSEQNCARPVDFGSLARPNRCQSFGFAVCSFVRLFARVIVGMHHHRFGTINHPITLGATPSGVFVIFRILHLLQKSAPYPDVLAQSAADHAEKVLPSRRLSVPAKTTLVIVRIDGRAIGTRNLAAKTTGGPFVLQLPYKRAQPIF